MNKNVNALAITRQQQLAQNISAKTISQTEATDAGIDFSNVKRNDLCPCGSGKKFKNCCGKKAF
ncbi:SEC-C metal-binding domain-containing protein [Streptococcus iniae]